MPSNMSNLPPSCCNSVVVGALLRSRFSQYLVESVLGQGTFGTVAKCRRIADRKAVAIKMMKNQDQQAKAEVAVLLKLQLLDSDKCNLVRWYQSFISNEHICLVFEHLDKSLHDFMEDRGGQPLHPKEIRPIVQQLANALDHLKVAGIIHADLKLENIMLVNHAQEPYRVKVIDFGLACDVSAARLGSYLQSLPYRSPEIILGLPFTEAIDMWSLGAIIATLYLGVLLYPGMSEYDVMRYIVASQGQPPDTMLTLGRKTGHYFQQDHNSTNSSWKLKTPEQFCRESGIQSMETRVMKLSSLYDLMLIRAIDSETTADRAAESSDVLDFVDLLTGMLQLDAAKRLTPRQVLKHRFTSMQNMVWMYQLSSYVRSCCELMNTTTDSRKAVCGSLQQPSSGTAHPIQQNLPSASGPASTAVSTPLAQARPNTQTQCGIRPVTKRKAVVGHHRGDDRKRIRRSYAAPATSSSYSSPRLKRKTADREDSDDRHGRKRVKNNNPAPLTCSSQDHTDDRRVRPDRRSVPAEHHRHHTSSRTQTESWAPSGKKRKSPDVEYVGHQCSADRKRIRRSHAAPATSSSYSSQRLKRKTPRDDSDDRQERKRVKSNDPAPPTCSSQDPAEHHRHHAHTDRSQTESQSRSRDRLRFCQD